MSENRPLLETRNLRKYFDTPRGLLHAVEDVNLSIAPGETLGVVGESGCGKSTLGRTILRLLPATGGEVLYEGQDVLKLRGKELKNMHVNMQMIFQDPFTSLNPRLSISNIIAEPMKVCGLAKNRQEMNEKVRELMEVCGLPARYVNTYPHELDGGRRQRVGLARALAVDPKFIVCDEPVSALDVSIQAQILNLLMDLQEELDLAYMFVTHDLSVVKHISDNIMVMYLGRCVELAPSDELFANPQHPYTKALLAAIPEPDLIRSRNKKLEVIRGEVTSPIDPKPGCRFAARCEYCDKCGGRCTESNPEFVEVSPGHYVSCFLVNDK